MEQILLKLLVADNKIIQQGTKELKEEFKKPNAIPELCDLVVASQNPEIRQTAAVLLRRKLGKKRQWLKLPLESRNRIKQGMLQGLVNEQVKLVKNSIAQLIGILGKHETPDNSWPEVLQFVHTLCNGAVETDREMGMYTLSIMTEISQGSYLPHANSLSSLFSNILNSITELDSNVAYYTIVTMTNLVSVMAGLPQMMNTFSMLLPRILEIIVKFAQSDEKRAGELFEILDELIEYAVHAVLPHLRVIVNMCLQLSVSGNNNNVPTSVQIKAVCVICWLIRSKGKVILKCNLVEPIIDALIKMMAQQPEDEMNEEYFLDESGSTTITVATQALDLIALHIPADKFVPYLLTIVEPAIQSGDIYVQKAAYLSLAVLAEGCAEKIRHKYIKPFLKCVCEAIHNPNIVVRNAAFFALGQFAEHLQPEISQYSAEVLPILFDYLDKMFLQMQQEKKQPNTLDKLFYALETFCENLEEGLLVYLGTLMDRLFVALDPNGWSVQVKRIALSTLGCAVSAVKEGFLPYFERVIAILNVYINSDPTSEIHELQSCAIETLSVIAQYIGEENFKPLAIESLQLGMRILENSQDPDVRKSVYALFASLSIVMKGEISPALPKMIEEMINSIQSSDGIVASFEDNDENEESLGVLKCLSEEEDTSEDEEEDIDVESSSSADSTQCRYAVENSYNDEKEQACLSLREICINTGLAFLPYIEKCFEEIFKLLDYPQDDIRKASIEALVHFCVSLCKINTAETKQALYKGLQVLIPKCSTLIRTDEERSVVMCCLDAFGTLLEEVKNEVLVGEGHREAIMNCVVDVLTFKTICQDTDLDPIVNINTNGVGGGGDDDDDEEAEQDELLLESAGDVIPKFGAAITPDDFVVYFPNILQLLTQRTKKQNSLIQRAFSLGTLAECMKSLDVHVEKFVPLLLEMWLTGAKDQADEVRNNAIYGLGEMILCGKDRVFPYFNQILHALSVAVSKESHAGTLDNICGALAKMIFTNPDAIPLEQVFPAFIQHLPLREDLQENEAVIKCFYQLYQQGNGVLKQHLGNVIEISVMVFHKEQTPNEETKRTLVEFIKTINKDFSNDFSNIVSSLGPEVTNSIQKLFV